MNQHLTRLVEARLHYFASVGAILAALDEGDKE